MEIPSGRLVPDDRLASPDASVEWFLRQSTVCVARSNQRFALLGARRARTPDTGVFALTSSLRPNHQSTHEESTRTTPSATLPSGNFSRDNRWLPHAGHVGHVGSARVPWLDDIRHLLTQAMTGCHGSHG